jgi:phosphatidylserine/phosphatidylglycerophosphate/cardiolipin synthase-like enzyme
MLNPLRRNGEEENEETHKMLVEAGIVVKNSNPNFSLTHEKSMMIDDRLAFIKSLNLETKNLTETRDYAIITNHPKEVAEIILCFEADWDRKNFEPGNDAYLIWCSGNGRSKIANLLMKLNTHYL